MKDPSAVTADIERRMKTRWHTHLTGVSEVFPHAFPLGRPTAAELKADYASFHARTLEWRNWACHHGVELVHENRVAKGGSIQVIPTRAKVTSIDQAATIVGGDWPDRLARGRERLAALSERYAHVGEADRVLRLLDRYSNLDFTLLTTVADWFLADPSRAELGVTPRQVPVPGVHAKWLQSHRAGVQALTGLNDLGILPVHPPRIHFTYLDPDHRSSGARIHDSATVGDSFEPAYMPEIVIVSENKDTAIHFPPLTGGIALEGVGKGGKTPAAFPWIREAPVLVYWGDIDRDGYEILDGYRRDFSRDIASILMDPDTYEAYEQFGTDLDPHGHPLTIGDPKPVDLLHADERSVYARLLDEKRTGHRRIEQERIPLDRALEAVIEFCRD